MKRLKLKNRFQANATILPNEFIDHYMVSANGEFVKVYLLLLRYLNEPGSVLTVSMIADCLNNTENDVLRAFRYWESTGLLRLTKDADGSISGIELLSSDTEDASAFSPGSSSQELTDSMEEPASVMNVFGTVPDESSGTFESSPDSSFSGTSSEPIAMDAFRSQKELKSLFFIAEQYLGKTLSHTDVDMITYFYNELHMSSSLIEYLLETCVESGHKSMHYIQKVAIAWAKDGISTVSPGKGTVCRLKPQLLYCPECLRNQEPADRQLLSLLSLINGQSSTALKPTSSRRPAAGRFLQRISQVLNMQTVS